MSRLLKYAAKSYGPLAKNSGHRFAQSHALKIYKSNAIYSFIPKNACSTMRLSLALANCCIKDPGDFNWIHKNNETFVASLSDLVTASYTFTVLRDPFSRLVSVFFDKFLERDLVAWRFVDLNDRMLSLDDVTFETFVRALAKPKIREGNIHWRPQVDFLVYDDYDDYFSVEEFGEACLSLSEKIGLEVVDARPYTKHQTSGYGVLTEEHPYKMSLRKLFNCKRNGQLPAPGSMYSRELADIVINLYDSDIALYRKKITPQGPPLLRQICATAD